jgi:hypothetical protein
MDIYGHAGVRFWLETSLSLINYAKYFLKIDESEARSIEWLPACTERLAGRMM